MKFVVLNLADAVGWKTSELLQGTVQAREVKVGLHMYGKEFKVEEHKIGAMGEYVKPFDLGTTALQYRDSKTPVPLEMRGLITSECDSADKILVATHGWPAREKCFIDTVTEMGMSERIPLFTPEELAQFLDHFLSKTKRHYIVLVMCYGGRSATFDIPHHEGRPLTLDLTTSFAFKLFRALLSSNVDKLAAWTTMLNFNPQTGKAVVENERDYLAILEQGKLIKEKAELGKTAEAIEALSAAKTDPALLAFESAAKDLLKTVKTENWTNLDQKLQGLKMGTETKLEKELEVLYQLQLRTLRARWIASHYNNTPSTPSAGKLLYSRGDADKIGIYERYPELVKLLEI